MAILAHLAKLTTQPINQPTDCYRQNYLNCSFFKSGSYLELPYQILAKSDKNGNFSPFTFSHIDQPTDQPLSTGKITLKTHVLNLWAIWNIHPYQILAKSVEKWRF